MQLALRQRHRAVAAWREWNHARSAFTFRAVRFGVHSARRPLRSESRARWLGAAVGWHNDRDWYREHAGRLIHKMHYPGGTSCGTRWLPLARWVGWPEYTLSQLSYIIMRESSGRPTALNPSSHCSGLLQLISGWYTGAWGPPAGNPFDPEYNLRTGLWIWRHGGWSAWAL